MKYTSKIDNHVTHISKFEAEDAIANFVIVHGMAEHRHRYIPFAKELVQNGFNVYTLDLRGHGDSPFDNKFGYFGKRKGYQHNIDDIAGIIKDIKSESDLPLILFGHSMGSLFVRAVVKQNPDLVNQLIVSGSPYKPVGVSVLRGGLKFVSLFAGDKPAKKISSIMNTTFCKHIENPKTPVDWLSFDTDNVDAYVNDPLCNFPFTYRGYVDLFDLLKEVYDKKWDNVKRNLPILMLIGLHDPCPDFDRDGFNRAIEKLSEAGFEDINTVIYENSRHELLNDVEKEDVIKDILFFFFFRL